MSQPDIDRLRRFHRIVTREAGALDQSFLGRGRPLNAARVLHSIGRDTGGVGEIRTSLGLDSGLMSRLLRGLEQEGLIETIAAPGDARRRLARLTPAGRAEVDAYETLSNDRARKLLAAHPDPDALLAAMDLVAAALGRTAVTITQTDPRSEPAKACLARYYGELSDKLETGFEVHLSRDPDAADMMPPRGVFLIALSDGVPIGCAGLKGHAGAGAGLTGHAGAGAGLKGHAGAGAGLTGHAGAGAAPWGEVKRVWVDPAARGLRLASRMMNEIETQARTLGFGTLRLDTNSALPEALALYRKLGWSEIARFNDDPYPDAFFEKPL